MPLSVSLYLLTLSLFCTILTNVNHTAIQGLQTMNELARPSGQLVPTDLDPIGAYLKAIDTSKKTKQTYSRALKAWTRYLDGLSIGILEATCETVLAYKEHLQSAQKAATVNAYLTALRGFYGWLEAQRVYPNIAATVKNLKKNKASSKDALTVSQAQTLLSTTPSTLEGLRNKALLNLMVRRGLRCVEITRADIGDIRQMSGEAVLWIQGKGHAEKDSFIVLNETCLQPIYDYLDARRQAGDSVDPSAPLFSGIGNRNHGGRMSERSVSRIAAKALEETGAKSARLTAHSLRHSAVTFALMGGAELMDAQAMARHENIQTTLIYSHCLDRMKPSRAENAVDAVLA